MTRATQKQMKDLNKKGETAVTCLMGTTTVNITTICLWADIQSLQAKWKSLEAQTDGKKKTCKMISG